MAIITLCLLEVLKQIVELRYLGGCRLGFTGFWVLHLKTPILVPKGIQSQDSCSFGPQGTVSSCHSLPHPEQH